MTRVCNCTPRALLGLDDGGEAAAPPAPGAAGDAPKPPRASGGGPTSAEVRRLVEEQVIAELAAHPNVEYIKALETQVASLERAKRDADGVARDHARGYNQLRVAYEALARQRAGARQRAMRSPMIPPAWSPTRGRRR